MGMSYEHRLPGGSWKQQQGTPVSAVQAASVSGASAVGNWQELVGIEGELGAERECKGAPAPCKDYQAGSHHMNSFLQFLFIFFI